MTSEAYDQHDRANAELLLLLREELAQATQEGTSHPLPVTTPESALPVTDTRD